MRRLGAHERDGVAPIGVSIGSDGACLERVDSSWSQSSQRNGRFHPGYYLSGPISSRAVRYRGIPQLIAQRQQNGFQSNNDLSAQRAMIDAAEIWRQRDLR